MKLLAAVVVCVALVVWGLVEMLAAQGWNEA